jgi:hypothetical protein
MQLATHHLSYGSRAYIVFHYCQYDYYGPLVLILLLLNFNFRFGPIDAQQAGVAVCVERRTPPGPVLRMSDRAGTRLERKPIDI